MHASSGGGVSTSVIPTQPTAPQLIPRPQPSILDLLRGPRRRQQEPATPQQQTLADIFNLQRNAQSYARQLNPPTTNPLNPPNSTFNIGDSDYEDPEDDDDYGDAISMYGDSISHTITQQQQIEEDKRERIRLLALGHLTTVAQQTLPIAHSMAQLHGATITVPSDPIATSQRSSSPQTTASKNNSPERGEDRRHNRSRPPERDEEEKETPVRNTSQPARRIRG